MTREETLTALNYGKVSFDHAIRTFLYDTKPQMTAIEISTVIDKVSNYNRDLFPLILKKCIQYFEEKHCVVCVHTKTKLIYV